MEQLRVGLQRVDEAQSASDKLALLRQVLQEVVSRDDVALSKAYFDGITSSTLGLVVTRQAMMTYIQVLKTETGLKGETRKGSLEYLLEWTQPRMVSFEDQITFARETLAEWYENDEDWNSAARTLQEIPLESGQRNVSNDYKLSINLKIVQVLLEADDPISAESYLNRAAVFLTTETPKGQQLIYKLSQAKILDAKRRFLDASGRYLELSHASEIDPQDRSKALMASVTCAILAPAGPQRSRLLSVLIKDERVAKLPEFYSTLLNKMFLERIIRPTEVASFANSLAPHQMARLDDGKTVFDRAVVEHNLLAASKIYNNIYFDSLGRLLGLQSGDAAEEFARKMIEQGRLEASIDQVNRLIDFEQASVIDAESSRDDQDYNALRKWDRSIKDLSKSNRLFDPVFLTDVDERVEAITNLLTGLEHSTPVSAG